MPQLLTGLSHSLHSYLPCLCKLTNRFWCRTSVDFVKFVDFQHLSVVWCIKILKKSCCRYSYLLVEGRDILRPVV